MASLKKRGNYWSIVFKKHVNGKPVRKTYALGTKYKKVAEHKQTEYEKLYQSGEIDPFDPEWNLKEYEKTQQEATNSTISKNYYLDDLKEEFLLTKKHLSSSTNRAYKSVIKLFIESVGQTMPVAQINHKDIRSFCFDSEYSNATKRSYLRHLKAFFNWLEDENHIESNPCEKVSPPQKKDKLVDKIIDQDDLQEIFNKFRAYQEEQQRKGYIKKYSQKQHWFEPLITMAFYTGMRRKEILNLKWEQVYLDRGEIHVTATKNGKERTVTVFDQVYYSLIEWRKFNGNPKTGLVFPSPRSNDKIEIKLEPNNVSRVFKKYAMKAKLKPSIHFHSLRHSNATFRLREGYDAITVKEELGHSSLEITDRYVHLVSKDRRKKAQERGHITYL